MLVNPIGLYKKARKGGYAIGAFNTSNVEITRAIIQTAEKLNSPVIVETSQGEAEHQGFEVVAAEVKAMAKEAKIPVVLHLDHGKTFEGVSSAIRAGYTSVHIDGSEYNFEENTKITRAVVELAHNNGVAVEGEIGHIAGTSSSHKAEINIAAKDLTVPEEANQFVKRTKVDTLAVAIGNIHGMYAEPPRLDFERFDQITKLVKKYFSLHGGSGIPKTQIQKAIEMGIVKVNVNTELRLAFREGLLHEFDVHPDEVVPYKYLPAGAEAVAKVVEGKIRLFGSENKA
jgi:ketose-bisphosphate aldolase